MILYIINNFSTISLALLLTAGLFAIIVKMKSDRKNGKSSCGSSCSGCPGAKTCHK